jgi:hypothetical protein
MGCDENLTVRVFIHVVACYSLIGCWGVDCDPCTLAPGATAAWLLDIGVCFSHSAVLIWDKIWPSPKHVWNEIILSRFFGSPLARSLARPSFCPPFVSGRRDYCLREGARAEEDRKSRFRQLQFRFHFLRFAVFKAFKVLLLLSDSIFSKFCMFLTLWDVWFSSMCWLVFSGKDVSVAEVCCPTASIFSESQSSKIWKIFWLIRFFLKRVFFFLTIMWDFNSVLCAQ